MLLMIEFCFQPARPSQESEDRRSVEGGARDRTHVAVL